LLLFARKENGGERREEEGMERKNKYSHLGEIRGI
jgi:hypothetical protein